MPLRFSEDPACTRGHFPGHPIVPGAFLLDEVIGALAAATGSDVTAVRVEAAKFPSPVRPGQCVDLHCDEPVSSEAGLGVSFRGEVQGRTVISGSLRFLP